LIDKKNAINKMLEYKFLKARGSIPRIHREVLSKTTLRFSN